MPSVAEPVSFQVRDMPITPVDLRPLPHRHHSCRYGTGWALPLAGHAQEWNCRVRAPDTLRDLPAAVLVIRAL